MGISHCSIKNNKEDCHELNSSRNDELKKKKNNYKPKTIKLYEKILFGIGSCSDYDVVFQQRVYS